MRTAGSDGARMAAAKARAADRVAGQGVHQETGHTLTMHTVRCGTSACTQHSFTSAIRAVCSAFARLRPHLPCMGLAWASPPAWVHASATRCARAQREVHASSEPSYLPPPPAGSVRRPVGGEREGGGVKIWPPRFLADSVHVGHTRHCLHIQSAFGTSQHNCFLPPPRAGPARGPAGAGSAGKGGGGSFSPSKYNPQTLNPKP